MRIFIVNVYLLRNRQDLTAIYFLPEASALSLFCKPRPSQAGFGIVIRSEFPILVNFTLNFVGN
jgi:hypothetical protein